MSNVYVFQHGWGFDATCWDPWLPMLSSEDTAVVLDRGYFGKKKELAPETITSCIVVTHSFGLHLIPPCLFLKSQKIVIISGFLHLHPQKEIKKSKAYLAWLKKHLKKDPRTALEQFYADCGYAAQCATPCVPLLFDDLMRLNQDVFDLSLIRNIPDITILHGTEDHISKIEKAQELHSLLPHSRLVTIEKANHALPFTHTLYCLEHVYDKHLLRGYTH